MASQSWFTTFSLFILLAFGFLLSSISAETSQESLDQIPSSPLSTQDLLLWGTYKPYLLSSITQRSKQSITVGLAFSHGYLGEQSLEDFKKSLKFRTDPRLTSDYLNHNGIDFSRQTIVDRHLELFYDVSFINNAQSSNMNSSESVSQHWDYLVHSHLMENQEDGQTAERLYSTFVYIALENSEETKRDQRTLRIVDELCDEKSTILEIWDPETKISYGYMRIFIPNNALEKVDLIKDNVQEVYQCLVHDVEKTKTWQVEEILHSKFSTDIFKGVSFLDGKKCQQRSTNRTNFFAVQITALKTAQVMVSYHSKEVPPHPELENVKDFLTGKENEFKEKVNASLPVRGVNIYKTDLEEVAEIQGFILSNLLAKIFYASGNIKTLNENNKVVPRERFGILQSRKLSPSGLLFQEGLDQAVVCKWDLRLCLELLKSQFEGLPENAWIHHEVSYEKEFEYQIEKNSKGSCESLSFILPIEFILNRVLKANETELPNNQRNEITSFLLSILPKLEQLLCSLSSKNPNIGEKSNLQCPQQTAQTIFESCSEQAFQSRVWLSTLSNCIQNIKTLHNRNQAQEVILEQTGLNKSLIQEKIPISPFESFPQFLVLKTKVEDESLGLLWTPNGILEVDQAENPFSNFEDLGGHSISMNLNYLILRGLKSHMENQVEKADLYDALKENILKLVSLNWKSDHRTWGAYDAFTGLGRDSNQSNSLVVLIYGEEYH